MTVIIQTRPRLQIIWYFKQMCF